MLAVAAAAALFWLALGTATPAPAHATDQAPAFVSSPASVEQPLQDAAADDQRLPVQMWTVFAAGAAAGVGLVLYLVRLAMGWVKPAPPQENEHH